MAESEEKETTTTKSLDDKTPPTGKSWTMQQGLKSPKYMQWNFTPTFNDLSVKVT